MQIVAIIPARGGSKGIPRKNIRPFKGIPLVAWSIQAALAARKVDRVIVSSDDDEIGGIAERYGAQFVKRPAELATDTASSESALVHVLEYLEQSEKYVPDYVVFLQCTSPLVEATDIDQAIDILICGNYDSLFSAYGGHFQGRWQEKDGVIEPINYDPEKRPTRQQYPKEYFENGAIYAFRPEVLRKCGARLGKKIGIYKMSPYRSFQIDSEEDWLFVERLMINNKNYLLPTKLSKIKLLVLDFDGVLTDNRVLVMEDGREGVVCNRGDSLKLGRLRNIGIEVIVLSTETNRVVAVRCEKIGIQCYQGIGNKLIFLDGVRAERGLSWEDIAYVGNDVNDLECMRQVGFPVAVADAVPEILEIALYTTRNSGGRGAVREVVDLLIRQKSGVGS